MAAEELCDRLIEIEALYVSVKDRIDLVMIDEAESNTFRPATGRLIALAAQLLDEHAHLASIVGVPADTSATWFRQPPPK